MSVVLHPDCRISRPPNPLPKGTPNRRAWYHWMTHGRPDCFYCAVPFTNDRPPTIDHVIPVSHGGHVSHGFVLACGACNVRRGNRPFRAARRMVAA